MKIEPKIRGFICTTAHPAGCRQNVKNQIDYVKRQEKTDGPQRVLVIGCSTGYGLASRIACAFSCGAGTLGVMFEKPASGTRTATAGWYNTAAFEEFAAADGLYAETINGDAFSAEIKRQTVERIRAGMGQVDCIIYSLAAPRRTLADGTTVSSVLKTTGGVFTNKTIDLKTGAVLEATVPAATEQEIADTVKVMGGEDWMDWIRTLKEAGVLADHVVTAAYSYIGPELTHPIYLNGSIGRAKQDLYETSRKISENFPGIKAYLSVNKALVTQSSAAIPVVPLYISLLYRVMKEKGLHEGCIEQMYRLCHDRLFQETPPADAEGRIRLDDWEMRPDVQAEVARRWAEICTENVNELADIDGYWQDFYQMFGFRLDGVDYSADADPAAAIPSMAR